MAAGRVALSCSTWQQALPETRSVRRTSFTRDRSGLGEKAAVALHRDRYSVAEMVYPSEVDPVGQADLVIDNHDGAMPRLTRGGL